MKIIIFVSYTYPFIGSGIGQVALKQAEGLAKLKHDVVLVSGNVPPRKKTEFRKNGVLHIKLNSLNFLSKINVPVPFYLFNKKVIGLIKNSDIVHSHDILYPNTLQALIWAKIFRKKFILTQHVAFVKYQNPFINLLEKIAIKTIGALNLSLADKVVIVNETLRTFVHTDEGKTQVLVNGVDTDLFSPASQWYKTSLRRKYKIPLNRKVVLFVGRFVPKKGVDILLKATDEKYLILLAGNGKLPEYKYAKGLVRVLGNISQKKLSNFYKLSDVFVLPSRDEGLPLSIQEALASGLPVVTTEMPGYRKYFKNMVVSYVRPDAESLHLKILRLLSDKKYGDRARLMVNGSLIHAMSWTSNVSELFDIYKSLLG